MSKNPQGVGGRVGTGGICCGTPVPLLGSRVPPPPLIMESPYLYPYVPQRRRARSKARVVKTRMRARPHVGSTSGSQERKRSISLWEGEAGAQVKSEDECK